MTVANSDDTQGYGNDQWAGKAIETGLLYTEIFNDAEKIAGRLRNDDAVFHEWYLEVLPKTTHWYG